MEFTGTYEKPTTLDYVSLNALLAAPDENGGYNLDADKQAVHQYFLEHVNQNTVFFHTLKEKLEYLVNNEYYEKEFLEQYSEEFIKSLYQRAYAYKFRFQSYLGALKYYTSYTLKTFDGTRYLERYEDRVTAVALYLAQGDEKLAEHMLDEMMTGRYQPATPTFLNAGKKQRGELVSCYLLDTSDNMESIGRNLINSLQLSKRGGGVAVNLTNLRETGAPIKYTEGASSGVIPVMKLLEDAFSYANQLGSRQGAGAVYLNVHHPDIMRFLDTKRENADEKIRIKTLSVGVIITDKMAELVKNKNAIMYTFSPYDVQREYGKPFSEINITEEYDKLVENPNIRKYEIKPRELWNTIAALQFESGYPYIMFEDTVNKANPIHGKITMSNLCLTGDTRLLTTNGYKRFADLYTSQEDIRVVSDNRSVTEDFSDASVSVKDSTRAFLTAKDAETYKISTKEGFELKATAWHKFPVEVDGSIVVKRLCELETGDHLLVQPAEGVFGKVHNPDLAYLAGVIAADGTFAYSTNNNGVERNNVKIYLYGDKSEARDSVLKAAHCVLRGREDLLAKHNATLEPKFAYDDNNDKYTLSSAPLAKVFEEYGFNRHTKHRVPEFVWQGDKETVVAYLSGLYQMDSCVTGSITSKNISIELGSADKRMLQEIQILLGNLGVYSRIYASRKDDGTAMLPNGNGGYSEYNQKANWTLRVSSGQDRNTLYGQLSWLLRHKNKWEELVNSTVSQNSRAGFHKFRATITNIEFHSIEDVYDVTVDDGHSIIVDGVSTRNCSEILQVSEPSTYDEDNQYVTVGRDISCNLGSMNIAKAMASPDFGKTVETAIRSLTAVSLMSNLKAVPSIERANRLSHAIGLGQMNLHGYLGASKIYYDSEEAIDFTNIYFYTVLYHALRTSNMIARERGEKFYNFEKSKYASGEFFDKYLTGEFGKIKTEKVRKLIQGSSLVPPTVEDWKKLKDDVMEYGLFNQNLQAVPPTGSISYINGSTSSIHPIAARIEKRKEGKTGRVHFPAPGMTNDNVEFFADAYELGYKPIINVYAAAQEHVDQGLSLTLFFRDTASVSDLVKAQRYAHHKGIKTLYYVRISQAALAGTEVDMSCVSCTL